MDPHLKDSDDMRERADQWKVHAQEAWQLIAELRQMLVYAVHHPLTPEELERARVLLDRSKKT